MPRPRQLASLLVLIVYLDELCPLGSSDKVEGWKEESWFNVDFELAKSIAISVFEELEDETLAGSEAPFGCLVHATQDTSLRVWASLHRRVINPNLKSQFRQFWTDERRLNVNKRYRVPVRPVASHTANATIPARKRTRTGSSGAGSGNAGGEPEQQRGNSVDTQPNRGKEVGPSTAESQRGGTDSEHETAEPGSQDGRGSVSPPRETVRIPREAGRRNSKDIERSRSNSRTDLANLSAQLQQTEIGDRSRPATPVIDANGDHSPGTQTRSPPQQNPDGEPTAPELAQVETNAAAGEKNISVAALDGQEHSTDQVQAEVSLGAGTSETETANISHIVQDPPAQPASSTDVSSVREETTKEADKADARPSPGCGEKTDATQRSTSDASQSDQAGDAETTNIRSSPPHGPNVASALQQPPGSPQLVEGNRTPNVRRSTRFSRT